MNPYRSEIQTESCCFLVEMTQIRKKGGIYESPPDRYVRSASPAYEMSKFNLHELVGLGGPKNCPTVTAEWLARHCREIVLRVSTR